MSASHGTRLRLGALLLGVACSTLADPPATEECTADPDCGEGFVCDQGRCLPGDEAAPRAHLGFDIRESVAGEARFRVEVDGCDCGIEEDEGIRQLALRRARVSQEFSLIVNTPDPAPDDLLTATFELSQASRFGLFPAPHLISSIDHPSGGGDEGEAMGPAEQQWARFHPYDVGVPADLVLWRIQPEGGDLALRYLGLVPPGTDADAPCEEDSDCCEPRGACNPAPNFCDLEVGECTAIGLPKWTYRYQYEPNCSRNFGGQVVLVDPQTFALGEPVPNSTVAMRYADGLTERFGIPVFGDLPAAQRPPQCQGDDDCDSADTYCDLDTQQCFVSLAGRSANRITTVDMFGSFATPLYTYCDAEPADAPMRRYEVVVTPPGARPSVGYLVDASFGPPQMGSIYQGGNFCVPDWGPAVELEIEFVGQPRTLISGEDEYACCDVGCLPATADDLPSGPPATPGLCDGRTTAGATPRATVESPFILQDLEAWEQADCAAPNPDEDGRLGSLQRSSQCTTPNAPCRFDDIALGTVEEPRQYQVRFESQVGSVVASGDYTLELGPEAPAVQTLALTPRVLVTGVVDVDDATCARRQSGEDCAAREAIVLAERIRMPDEPPGSVPGPYFHPIPTYYDPVEQRDGAFILPLDPGGVYVVTALPPAGAEGGPSGFTVVDLRDDAPTDLAPLRLVLEEGVVVTLQLDQFDQRTSVIPLDRGSYLVEGQTLAHPLRTDPPIIDLNQVGECWTPEGEGLQGCKIRRLIPPGSDLSRSQVGVARFTARRSAQAECPAGCPVASSE